ncbi:MAG: DNA-binding protein [Duncaniella sp.]|nr:DNA-binding protein [Bacteroides sp.]MBD5301043.1 DNA-binding protein [Bacteroides sp.]MBD5317717.1 DNA-binding protein [Bacteroides sp.]MDE5827227.1 DNA-binding protein [Duncaniella sp.]MDE7474636.1 DNA-binding protein [Duncaniella sp.]
MNAQQSSEKPYTYKKYGSTYVVSIANHTDLAESILTFCKDMKITAGSITGIGAINEATLRFYNPKTKQYVDKTFKEQMEVANLTGNVSMMNGETYTHLHCVLGRSDYTAIAGHLLTATLNGACEIVITTFDSPIERYYDEETGLNMYRF